MRIIAGKFKGRRLVTFQGYSIRPVLDKIKGSIFNTLGSEIVDKEVLDLFCGTGALGIEALSRGAKKVVFVDQSPKSLNLVRRNLKNLNLQTNAGLIKLPAEVALKKFHTRNKKFDLIFVDPPFLSGQAEKNLILIDELDILNEKGIVILRCHKKEELISDLQKLVLLKRKKIGDSLLFFLTYS